MAALHTLQVILLIIYSFNQTGSLFNILRGDNPEEELNNFNEQTEQLIWRSMEQSNELTLNTFSDLQGKLTALFNQEFSNLSMKYSKQYVWAKETMDRKVNNVRLAHESQLLTYRMQLEEHNRMEQDTIRRQYEQSLKDMEDTIGENLRKTKAELEKVTKERSALANVHHEMVQRQKELETAIEKMANERDKALKEATKIAEQSVKTVTQYDDLGSK